jgi:hypothetical protein
MLLHKKTLLSKTSKSILDLVDYERPPSVMDTKGIHVLTYRNTYKTLDDLNQDEMRLGGLRINYKYFQYGYLYE